MFELFKAELQRFRGWAIAYAALHLVVLFLICRLLDPGQQTLLFYQAFAAIYLLSGVVLGVVQMSGYRRGSAWLNLLHRPLAPWRIALALTGAGAVLLAAAIVLPLLAALGYQIAFTARVVDLRHGLLPLAALLLTSCGYLAGSYVTLANRRIAVTAIVFVLALYESRAGGVDALVVQALVLLWLAGLLWTAFKPDLSALPRSLPATLITALPLQMMIMLGATPELRKGIERRSFRRA
ncbi:hypothetical protein [Oleiagrimonas sp. MCCC 1A03011]|uniref:hypothetical protein n=1 Tax=Oleiagrimonas sp. MCCC 1A03011 TaxID=1926883 RepID=UPI000DC5FB46|nr:hypothetical protein [Oleiagrimonas sp. MCCC 1A03011]RAP59549.1 hypothetical protein BTJ49_02540 [Oleiagrimonas sp. MCCC 1A03011]